jgi:hypothetical protein
VFRRRSWPPIIGASLAVALAPVLADVLRGRVGLRTVIAALAFGVVVFLLLTLVDPWRTD